VPAEEADRPKPFAIRIMAIKRRKIGGSVWRHRHVNSILLCRLTMNVTSTFPCRSALRIPRPRSNHTVPLMHSGKDAFVDRFVAAEMKELKRGLQKYASDVWQMDLFVFLRAIQTNRGPHTYVQCIPTKRGLGKKPLAAVSQWHDQFHFSTCRNRTRIWR
jgi:hypothetical protein